MIEKTDKPTPWEGSGSRWFRRAAVWPNVLCHVRPDGDDGFWWDVMFGLPGICQDQEEGAAPNVEEAKRAADAAALQMIRDVITRMNEAVAALEAIHG